jgi:hypothetical protein
MAVLSGQSREYLQNLTKALSFIEKPPLLPLAEAETAVAPEKIPDPNRNIPAKGAKGWQL